MNGPNRKYAWYWMFVSLIGLAVLSGCPKNAEITAIPEPQQEQAPAPAAEIIAPPEQKMEAAKAEPEVIREQAAPARAGLQPVYFDFDKAFIQAEARAIMKENAEWLKAHPQTSIRIEGNCDERGTIEYNQALGQRRAASAKKYLTDLGVSEQRISVIGYGKEKPSCTESIESCWQKNRRDDFAVVDK